MLSYSIFLKQVEVSFFYSLIYSVSFIVTYTKTIDPTIGTHSTRVWIISENLYFESDCQGQYCSPWSVDCSVISTYLFDDLAGFILVQGGEGVVLPPFQSAPF